MSGTQIIQAQLEAEQILLSQGFSNPAANTAEKMSSRSLGSSIASITFNQHDYAFWIELEIKIQVSGFSQAENLFASVLL